MYIAHIQKVKYIKIQDYWKKALPAQTHWKTQINAIIAPKHKSLNFSWTFCKNMYLPLH